MILKNKTGSVLAYALVILAVVSVIGTSLLKYVTSQLKFSFYREDKEQAFQVAESGMYFYRWYLAHQVSGRTVQQIKDFWDSGTAYGVDEPYEAEFFDPEGGAIGKYRIEVQKPDVDSTILMVKVTGWTYDEPNARRAIQARFRRPSWGEFAVVANDVMRFGAGTHIYGKVHSNKGIRFDGVAHNTVSSSVNSYDDPDHSGNVEFGVHTHIIPPPGTGEYSGFVGAEAPNNAIAARTDVFLAGRKFPMPTIDFNGLVSDLNNLKTEARKPSGTLLNNCNSTGCYFDSSDYGRRIIFNSNGTFNICKVSQYYSSSYNILRYRRVSNSSQCTSCDGACMQTFTIPNKGIIFVENNVWVEGIINNKKVTLVAANTNSGPKANIYVGFGNLLYTNFDGKDILGVIAQQDITTVRDSLNNLTIDAALMAQLGRVGRDHYESHSYDKDTITINGSMATNLRYGFAYTDGTGYDNRILNFDNNLLYYPPPYFPTGTEYAIDLWDEL
jgi:hypothetical protein